MAQTFEGAAQDERKVRMASADILIVDDHAATREGLRMLLSDAGYAVDSVSDGAEALQKSSESDFKLALLDVQLPGIGGLDLLARWAEQPRAPRVIMMTGVDTTAAALGALRGHAYAFLPKPIVPGQLLEMVSKALSPAPEFNVDVLSARPEWVELLVPCAKDAAERIENFMKYLEADLPDAVREATGLAFRELLLNAIEWGGQLDPTRKVNIACLRAGRMVLYRIADPGAGFRFSERAHAAITQGGPDVIGHMAIREEQGLRPGGFGLMLVRANVDELLYNERQNEVVFIKYLDGAGQ